MNANPMHIIGNAAREAAARRSPTLGYADAPRNEARIEAVGRRSPTSGYADAERIEARIEAAASKIEAAAGKSSVSAYTGGAASASKTPQPLMNAFGSIRSPKDIFRD